jgi:glycine oxidase ThiO
MAIPDVLVIGGGVIGLSVARELAVRGMKVTVLSRDEPGSGASRVSAGMLELHYPHPVPEPLAPLCEYSRSLYNELSRTLRAETGVDIELDTAGTIAVALTGEEAEGLEAQALAIKQSRLMIDAEDWLKEEPGLGPEVKAALLLPDDHHVSPRHLCSALLLSCEARGVSIERGVAVHSVLSAEGRARGAATSAGPFQAGSTILAAGSWASQVAGLPVPVPVRPVRGQILSLEMKGLPRHVIQHQKVYLVPRPYESRLAVGATVEETGFDARPTAAAAAHLVTAGTRLIPALQDSRFIAISAGLRPGSPDDLPILGETPLKNLLLAAGHFRKGILLAPGTARVIADLVSGGRPAVALDSFGAGRFQS